MRTRGFTLVELVMVIMVTGIIAASITVFFKPAIDSYFDTRRRADLTDLADNALRRMGQDIRRAVPNSIRSVSATCFQLVPTIAGGRYRMASDTVNDTAPLPCAPSATCSAPLDASTGVATVFDVLSPLPTAPAVGDWIVINNQNGDDVYTGANRAAITAPVKTASVPADNLRDTDGLHRITAAVPVATGYDGGRFVAVANTEQTVTYTCRDRVLYRKIAAFGAADCAAGNAGQIVATDVASCTFTDSADQGFLRLRLTLSRDGESVSLAHGVHVSNVP
jgi:MSHA biogenesis protein MshO